MSVMSTHSLMSKSVNSFSRQELDKILKTDEIRRAILKFIPEELCFGENIDLSRWNILVNDKVLELISRISVEKAERLCIDASLLDLKEMFSEVSEFWSKKLLKRGLLYLHISGSKQVTDYGISKLVRGCPNLKDVDISGCLSITDASLREIGLNCRNLQVLSIASCQTIQGAGLVTIAECCKKLLKLNISRCHTLERYAVTKVFYDNKKLEELNISHLQCVGDEELRVLAQNCPRLLSLTACDTTYISDTGILSLSQNCPDLDLLDVSRKDMAYRITDVGMLALGQRCTSLRALRVNGCDSITDVGLSWLAQGCRALEEIDIGGCSKVTDAGMRNIGDSCHSLTSLNISHAKLISDIGITSISIGCPDLKSITCAGLYILADPRCAPYTKKGDPKIDNPHVVIGVAALAKNCKNLQHLDLTGCFRLNVAIQKHLAKKLLYLKKLNLTGCNQLSVESLTAVGTNCIRLEEIILTDCGSCVCSAPIQAFSRHVTGLRILILTRCEGVKASAIRHIANMNKLEKLDLTGCKTLDDESLLPLCEEDKVPCLKQIILIDCRLMTDTALAWLSNGCKKLQLVSVKGTSVTRHAAEALRECFQYSDMLFNQNFVGFWPKPQVDDRIMMAAYGRMIHGIIAFQSRVRAIAATKYVNQVRKEYYDDVAARIIQRFSRKVRGIVMLRLKREEKRIERLSALKILSILKMLVAMRVVQEIRRQRYHELREKCALIIQKFWNKYCEHKRMIIQRARYLAYLKHRIASAIKIQALARRSFANRRTRILREFRDARRRLRERKALVIQRVYRGYIERQFVRNLRKQLVYENIMRNAAATNIQSVWRQNRSRRIVREMKDWRCRRIVAAITIQAAMRGQLARWDFQIDLLEKRFETRTNAATAIQTIVRMRQARFFVERLRREAYVRFLQRSAAATVIAYGVRMWLAKLELRRRRRAFMEAMSIRVMAQVNAATKIQAAYRGKKGRIIFKEKLRQKKGQWKELFDEDKKKRFFYNKLTGEIRWRMPQDLLDLIPRPVCDNCCFYEGVTECKDCNEVFCGECWGQIHFGGRRKDHKFRSIYDYYDKRVDYGEGEFPSKWPTEMMQDEIQGWMLRIAPIRDPVDVTADWEHYQDVEAVTDVNGTVSVMKDFYFNRKTFETSYETPQEVTAMQYTLNQSQYGYTQSQSQYDYTQDQSQYGSTYRSASAYTYGTGTDMVPRSKPTGRSARDGIPRDAPRKVYQGQVWVQLWDPQENSWYWYCQDTQESQWEEPGKNATLLRSNSTLTSARKPPTGRSARESPISRDAPRKVYQGQVWIQLWDPQEISWYWYCQDTQESQWEEPGNDVQRSGSMTPTAMQLKRRSTLSRLGSSHSIGNEGSEGMYPRHLSFSLAPMSQRHTSFSLASSPSKKL